MGEIKRLTQDEAYMAIKGDVDLHNAMLDEAEENGFEQGVEQGILEKEKEDAINLYDNGVSKELICKSLNITEERLELYIAEDEK